jgi:hypothetical protein
VKIIRGNRTKGRESEWEKGGISYQIYPEFTIGPLEITKNFPIIWRLRTALSSLKIEIIHTIHCCKENPFAK